MKMNLVLSSKFLQTRISLDIGMNNSRERIGTQRKKGRGHTGRARGRIMEATNFRGKAAPGNIAFSTSVFGKNIALRY